METQNTQDPRGVIVGYTVIEFFGNSDPFFGGTADDRPLGRAGRFMTGTYLVTDTAVFVTEEAANEAAARATNKRPAGKVSVLPAWSGWTERFGIEVVG